MHPAEPQSSTPPEPARLLWEPLSVLRPLVTRIWRQDALATSLGEDTTVQLFLPRSIGQKLPPQVGSPTEGPSLGTASRRVLPMEHNHGVAAALEAVLESMDPRQRMSQASDDALVVLQSGARYDLVLSDVQMPEKTNGIDLTE